MTWVYLPVLNALIQILITIALGFVSDFFGIVSADRLVPEAVHLVFYVLLPSLIINGIGIQIDLYTESNVWAFIVAFLILRAIALILSLAIALFVNWNQQQRVLGLGDVAVLWLSLSWISTVILGVPICTAVFENPTLGAKYGIMAGISSFIFQLPLQLMFLECHAAEEAQRTSEATGRSTNSAREELPSQEKERESAVITIQEASEESFHQLSTEDIAPTAIGDRIQEAELHLRRSWWSLVYAEHLPDMDLWLDILRRVLKNPVVDGIFVGIVISLSTAGRYLRCPSDTCVEGLEWISATLGWLGNCVSPLSLFAMGAWMHSQRKLILIPIPNLCVAMVSKLIVVPLLMVGLAKGMKLNNESARAAVLIATLPISLASFSLARQYNVGEKDLAANVAFGTLLMLPTVIVWNIVLDSVGLYPRGIV